MKSLIIGVGLALIAAFGGNAFMLWKISKKVGSVETENRLYRDSIAVLTHQIDSINRERKLTEEKIASQIEKVKAVKSKIGGYKKVDLSVEQAKKDLGL